MPKAPVAPQALKRIVATRGKNVVERFFESADPEQIELAASASTDFEAMVAILNNPAVIGPAKAQDPLAAASLRGLKMMRDLLAAGGGQLTAGQVAERLRISPQAVNQRRTKNQLVAVDVGRNAFMYPAWQFVDGGGTLQGLKEVLKALADNDCEAWDLLTFFLNKNHALRGRTPIEELKKGNLEGVLRAAKAYDQQGAA